MAKPVPTITTIAEAAGVSIASVSRVFNGQPVRDSTRRRVLAEAERLGYVPNAVARSLKSNRTDQVAFAVEDIGNPVYLAMLREIQPVLRADGFRLVVHSTGGDPGEEIEVLRGLGRRHADGLVISPIRVTPDLLGALAQAAAPVVVIGSVPPGTPVDNVRADSRTGVRLALRHLLDIGRRRIGFVNGPLDTVPGERRDAAFRDGMAEAGRPVDEGLVHVGGFRRETGAEGARRLLAHPHGPPDALLCANDLIALGALDTLRAAGLRVPDDVAVVGMDDTELAAVSWPTLTSVCLGSAERGRRAAGLLLDRLRGAPPAAPAAGSARTVTVAPRLVVRASTTGGDQ
ncbi:LacI family transcriptional regulator [Streptomonospora sp. S1-112]|uniref:LacI family transcriptional regulator n=1 Tax=Streptomonospora mangrovi TaxID=2883123 RepID=A0A9X3NJD4_9ACTN|nr:LacI family DNA-binding transcriptional regulator [Streptomonospora mangrovi]MDA0564353.1 LacI family transcriptional regulator [Streptomonospora mangrovi]